MTWTGTVYRGRKASEQRARIDLEGAKLTVGRANETRSWDLAAAAVTRRHWGLAGGTVLHISGATGELTVGAAAVGPQATGPKRSAPAYLINPAWYADLIAAVAGQAGIP